MYTYMYVYIYIYIYIYMCVCVYVCVYISGSRGDLERRVELAREVAHAVRGGALLVHLVQQLRVVCLRRLPAHTPLLSRNVERFRGGLVSKAHRFLHHWDLSLREIKKKTHATSHAPPRHHPREWT